MTSNNLLLNSPIIFTGENYHIWSVKMQAFLEAYDLWEIVSEDKPVAPLPTNPTIAQIKFSSEEKAKKSKAKSIIQNSVAESIFYRIMACNSAKEAWNKLKEEYQGSDRTRQMQVLNLKRDFEALNMQEDETISKYSDRISLIINNIRLLGEDFPDSRIVEKVLVTLPERFESKISSLEESKDLSKISLGELMSALQAQEQRRTIRQDRLTEGAFYVQKQQAVKGKKLLNLRSKGKNEGGSTSEGSKQKKFPPCTHCKRNTHSEKYCWWRPDAICGNCKQSGHITKVCKFKNSDPKPQQAHLANEVDTQEEQFFAVTCFSTNDSADTWLIDSGCTHHLCNDAGMFKTLDESYKSRVKVGNGEFLEVKGRGSVNVQTSSGGCGACIVLLSKYDPVRDQVEDFTVSSCLTLLCSVNGCSVTTSEGLGNSKDGFHPIHQRFSGFHASQCGFCTPGMCVSLFGALVKAGKNDQREPCPGFSKLTVVEAEKSISGNLCRCTGYRPIADACKSFAADVDIEDLGLNSFWKKEESHEAKMSRLPLYDHNHEICTFPEFLKREIKSSLLLDSERYSWCTPATVEELQSLLKSIDADSKTRMKLVVGNTGMGYYKDLEHHDRYIDLGCVLELSSIRRDEEGIEIGAAVTISKTIEALKEENNSEFNSECKIVFKRIALHMEKIASEFVRNTGSVGGNLVMAQRKHFPSDIATILLAAGAFVHILTGTLHEKLTLDEFLERPPLDSKSVLLNIKIPNYAASKNISSEMDSKLLFETYRAAPRPLGNALPYLNAAFLSEVSCLKSSGSAVLNKCRVVFGAYGTKHAIRAKEVEKFLSGKILTIGVLYEAVKLVKANVVPEDGTPSPAYRSSLAAGYLFDFLYPLIDINSKISGVWSDEYCNTSLFKDAKIKQKYSQLDHVQLPTLLSSSEQVLELNNDHHPVGQPTKKVGAALQASGEAVFVDDIPSPTNCLHGAFIHSMKPYARVKDIKFKSKSLPDGVSGLISVRDIPEGGENRGCTTSFGTESLFADELTQYAGERLAFVVADTQKHADIASSLVEVDYDIENLEPPILTVEEAIKRSSLLEVPLLLYPKQVGDISKGLAEADHKILSAKIKLGSQYHFYMETQTALAIPDENNCMVVYSSTQCPEYAHVNIAKCLGIPEHNVRVITRRVGGGFGGKAMKAIPVATACALAAHKFRRPVRTYLNRKTDMIMAGGRHPMEITYNVGFKSNGKVTALQLDILINAGISLDISPLMPKNILSGLKKYDWGALSFDIKVCKTNHSSKTAMRGPGEVQGSYIAETVIEHVASTLSMDVDSVRNINFHRYDSLKLFYDVASGDSVEYTLTSIWNKLAESSSFKQRVEIIKEFNRCKVWKKRGISRVPIVHQVFVGPTPGKVSILSDGSVVVEVGGIELGQGLWTKVKQMAAFALSSIKCEGVENLLDKVRVIQADTLSLTQGGMTAGSTTSESSCESVRLCCAVLVERLAPLKETLQGQMGSVTWDALICKAYMESLNLSASSRYIPDFTSMHYLNYGAAVSEVEVNLLTGETTILRSDIIYDCGQSLNPAVDLGQIEGAFVQGIGFFMLEEYTTNSDGLVVADSTWTYKIPTIDTIPKQFNVEIHNSGHHQKRVLSSKASGEPPLLLAASVHCAARAAIRDARQQLHSWGCMDESYSTFNLEVPATMPKVKELCGLDNVERYLGWKMGRK